ncbi:MAG: DNA replication and repair protein RecF [Candidatus Hydrogenedentes bacterium ADurb.Bin101]|nr:MAG: DNA replication and repair protein RecF [Candidatus Hydrogenedentes bacterium ADurb.Bin101]
MRLTRVQCGQFRGLKDMDFIPGPRFTLLSGANAQGKTSMLEAILYAATTRSHRTSSDDELARYGTSEFHIRIDACSVAGAPVYIEANWWRYAKRFKVSGIPQTRLSDVLGKICVTFFAPEDIVLVKGAASGRRLYLDLQLSQMMPPYLRALQRYRQALRQRNELLRRQCADPELLAPWESQLAVHGKILVTERDACVRELSDIAATLYGRIVEEEPLELVYKPDIADPENIARVLGETRNGDLQRKTTGRGPHRDDMEIRISGKEARNYGSQGQQKSAALVLKLAEVELTLRRMGEYPVVLLDEALAELDSGRAARLFSAIPDEAQALITTAHPEQLPAISPEDMQHFHIEGGRLEKK